MMTTTNSTNDKLTRTATAFASFAALVASCRGGYTPSLRRKDFFQRALGLELEGLGFRVFWG